MAVSQATANGHFQNKQWFSEFDYLFFGGVHNSLYADNLTYDMSSGYDPYMPWMLN